MVIETPPQIWKKITCKKSGSGGPRDPPPPLFGEFDWVFLNVGIPYADILN